MQQAADRVYVTYRTQETGPMNRYAKNDLKVGERVVLMKYADSVVGEVAERLDDEYVLVKWRDSLTRTQRVRALGRLSDVSDRKATEDAA